MKSSKITKNREQTEAKLVTAMAEVLAEKGFGKLGVNAVAKQAGVDKVLIYRYFNGLDGLMERYANSSEFWPPASELLGDEAQRVRLAEMSFADGFVVVFRRYANALRSRPLTLEILSWETIERNALTIAMEEVRESMGLELMAFLSELDPPEADWQAIANLFSAGIHYLAIRARKVTTYTGMSIAEDEGWERLIASIGFLVSNIEAKQGN